CDACGNPVVPVEGTVSWVLDERGEHAFALTHEVCVPATASSREELRRLVWPSEFLRFVTDRFGHRMVDPEALRAIVSALAPFVMRPDNAAEMEEMRAATIGQIPGVKPGTAGKAKLLEERVSDAGK
ncbi:MAG: hypothetical protein Q7S41_04445, partial [Candidatus Limnocylindria bacterium]|nr:hypothetical protein [Candidatus Limnocylindria bacterium]